MSEAFICDVVKKNPEDGTWDVRPRIVEVDGTNAITIKAKPVGGIQPQTGDVVLVLPIRNNLDDKKINRWYGSSDANGRIVAVAKPMMKYVFEGDFEIDGDIGEGNLKVKTEIVVGATEINVTKHGHITVLGPTVGPILPIQ